MTVSYPSGCKNVGTYGITVKLTGNYSGEKTETFEIVKAANPVKVAKSTKTVKLSKVKKKAQTVKALTVTKNQGKVIYAKVSGKSYFKVNSKTGKITVKKGTPKGKYTVKVKVTAKGNKNYKSKSKTVAVKIVVK